MKIEHGAVWVRDIERTRQFFESYFEATASNRYDNSHGFSSYFLSLPDGSTRIEIMTSTAIHHDSHCLIEPTVGMGHIAISLGSKEMVDDLTQQLIVAGHTLISGPRTTGDGYYESCIYVFGDFFGIDCLSEVYSVLKLS